MAMFSIAFGYLFLFLFSITGGCSAATEFKFDGFRKVTNLSLFGSAVITSNGVLQLTNDSKQLMGHAFFASLMHMLDNDATSPVVVSFSTNFVFAITSIVGGGGAGLAFVVSPSQTIPGAVGGEYLGLFGEANNGNSSNHVFAIEFDTVQNPPFNDINDNHVGVDVNSLISNVSEPVAYYTEDGKKVTVRLEDGQPIQAWIDYRGDTKLLNVTIAPLDVQKPQRPLISQVIDLSTVLKEYMYVGFSASTGKLTSFHYILGWSFRLNGEAASLDLSQLPSLPRSSTKSSNSGTVKTSVITSAVTIAIVGLAISVCWWLWQRAKLNDNPEDWELECPHRFRYKDLYKATKGFKDTEILGIGGFGKVYKGTLPSTGELVAIKKISNNSRQGVQEFVAEIASLGRLRHRNLVHLQGWCKRNEDLLLVYDFMSNGSFDTYLFSAERSRYLSWNDRFKIVKGIASGLLYLHEEWQQVVLHRDIKASNVLLDAEMNGRLGDFGLAKLYEHGSNLQTTHIVGTLGYIAPEFSSKGKATPSSDVFAYGILLLEVACGRRAIEPYFPASELALRDWVLECTLKGQQLNVVDPKLEKYFVIEQMELMILLGLFCSQPVPELRPTMRQVVQYLNGEMKIESEAGLLPLESDSFGLTYRGSGSISSIGLMSTGSIGGR